jgi:hypothetical protein
VLGFYESAYQAGARLAGWDIAQLACPGGITDPHRPQHLSWKYPRRRRSRTATIHTYRPR